MVGIFAEELCLEDGWVSKWVWLTGRRMNGRYIGSMSLANEIST